MAKAKKTEKADREAKETKAKPAATTKKSAAAAVPAAKAKAPAAKKPAAAGPATTPLIDTNLAASAAAAMVRSRAVTGGAAGGAAPVASGQPPAKKESASFKNLKDSLNKSAGSTLGGILGSGDQQKKSNLPFGGGKQVGRNQTFGADVNRAGVPRRTPG